MMTTNSTKGQSTERLEKYMHTNSKGQNTLIIPEGKFVRWVPKQLYTMELEELALPFMKLLSFPVGGTSLGKLTSLKTFDLKGNNLTKIPASFSSCSCLQQLYLGFNCLTKVPASVCELKSLTVLDISENDITEIDPKIGQLVKLKTLDASGNLYTDVPNELSNCSQLRQLNLAGKWFPRLGLKSVPSAICELKKLVHLNLSWNTIESLPDGIGNLAKLETLNLKGNTLRHVSPNIGNCTRLRRLLLTGAMKLVYAVPAPFFTLRNLTMLDMSDNYFTDIPPGVSGLEQLEVFIMQRNSLIRIPGELFSLAKLSQLDLSENYISVIPVEIGHAKSLTVLSLSRNRVGTLPDEISTCTSLQKLMADNNDISMVPRDIYKLEKLDLLDLSNNKLKELPLLLDRLVELERSGYLSLHGNTLVKPPQEICDDGVQALFVFLKELRKSEARHRQKMILIGAVKAGKTSLRSALILGKSKLTAEHERTWVMERHLWEPDESCRIQVLDFGGHHIYSAAHHMFLTPEALHLVVFDLSVYTHDKYDDLVGDWIEAIMERAPGAEILLVGTHKDLCDEESIAEMTEEILRRMHEEKRSSIDIMQTDLDKLKGLLDTPEARNSVSGKFTSLEVDRLEDKMAHLQRMINTRQKLPNQVFVVSCAEDLDGISSFRSKLLDCVKGRGEKSLPHSWQRVLLALQNREEKILNWDQVNDIFANLMKDSNQSVGIAKQDHLSIVLKYLHVNGEIVWYHDNQRLRTIIFHRPEVLIEMLRSIFRHDFHEVVTYSETFGHMVDMTNQKFDMAKNEFLRHGLMTTELLHFCLLHFRLSSDAIDIFISLMLKFDLCYEVPHSLSSPKLLGSKKILNFPWFLSEATPERFATIWPEHCPANVIELRMVVDFPRKGPPNFFEKLSVRIQRHVYDRTDWKDGILAHKNNSQLLIRREKLNKHHQIVLAVRGSNLQEMWSLVILPRADMLDLLAEWPCTPRMNIYSVCPHCILMRDDDPHIYPGEVFEAKCPRGVFTLQCCDKEPDLNIPACFLYALDPDFEDDLDKHFKIVADFLQRCQINEKYGLLTDMGLYYIASQLGFEWTLVAIYLGVKQAQIEQVMANYPNNVFQQIVAALTKWRDQISRDTIDGQPSDDDDRVDKLLKSLSHADRLDLVEDIKERYNFE